jgi:hypothetical protein
MPKKSANSGVARRLAGDERAVVLTSTRERSGEGKNNLHRLVTLIGGGERGSTEAGLDVGG